MQPFVIGEEQKQELALLKQSAEANQFSAEAMRKRIKGTWEPGNEILYTCYIPVDYKVVFTIEAGLQASNLENTGRMYRHLSVSIGDETKTPHPYVCQEIMDLLGFVNTLQSGKCLVGSERKGVINIIEFI